MALLSLLDGDTLLVGAPRSGIGFGSGAAFVYVRASGGIWVEQAKLLPEDGGRSDYFGGSVALDGDTAVIGARSGDGQIAPWAGSAYVFVRDGTTWSLQSKLLANDGASGDAAGWAVALSGGVALVGAPQDDDQFSESGSVYVFSRTGTTWQQRGKFSASHELQNAQFGYAIDMQGDTAVVGAFGDSSNGELSGAAYIFTSDVEGVWTQQKKFLPDDGRNQDRFGAYVAIHDEFALIGTMKLRYRDKISAYVFSNTSTDWQQDATLVATDANAYDSGYTRSLALSSEAAVLGGSNGTCDYFPAKRTSVDPGCNTGTAKSRSRMARTIWARGSLSR